MGFGLRSWTRSKVTATLSIALVVAAAVAGPSGAQEAPPETDEIGNGTAKAVAIVTNVAPGVGGLELGAKMGVSVAETLNRVSQSESQGVNLGLVGTALTAEDCDDAPFEPDDLPQPIRVDNRKGDASATEDEVPLGPAGAMRMRVEATTVPSARAISHGTGIEIPGLLDLGVGRAVAETEVLPGEGRQAHAVVQTDLDLGGVISLRGMRWEALHRTGTDRVVEGTFELAGAEVGGIPIPLEEVQPLQQAVNAALEFTGVSIELPRVETFTEPADLVRVTPLRIVIRDSPAGATLLSPALNASREAREQLFQALGEAVCELRGALLVADIGIAIGAGSGFLTVDIGGVEALSGDFEVGGSIEVPSVVAPAAPVPGDGPASGPVTPPASPSIADPAVPGSPDSGNTTGARPVADLGPLETVCETVHPFDWPSCSRGAAPLVGLIGMLATGSVFALDYRRQRAAAAPVTVDEPVST